MISKYNILCILLFFAFSSVSFAQSYSGCVITGVDYAIRTDFPVYETPAGTSETYSASGCSPSGASNTVYIYNNSSTSGNIGSRCYNISPSPSNIKNCKVTVSGIGRCGYIARLDIVQCSLDNYAWIMLGLLGAAGFYLIRMKS